MVRDSGERSGTILEFTLAQWRGFVQRWQERGPRNGPGAVPAATS